MDLDACALNRCFDITPELRLILHTIAEQYDPIFTDNRTADAELDSGFIQAVTDGSPTIINKSINGGFNISTVHIRGRSKNFIQDSIIVGLGNIAVETYQANFVIFGSGVRIQAGGALGGIDLG